MIRLAVCNELQLVVFFFSPWAFFGGASEPGGAISCRVISISFG